MKQGRGKLRLWSFFEMVIKNILSKFLLNRIFILIQSNPISAVKSNYEFEQRIEGVFQRIFALEKRKKLGLFGMVAHFAYEQDKKELHIKELKEQIYTCRENMQEVYGQKIIEEIDSLPIKFRKLKAQQSKKSMLYTF